MRIGLLNNLRAGKNDTGVGQLLQFLKSYPEVTFLKEIFNHPSAPIRAFMIADPGGYTLEVFQWLTDEDP